MAFLDGETCKDLGTLQVCDFIPMVQEALPGGPISHNEAGYAACGLVTAVDVDQSLQRSVLL